MKKMLLMAVIAGAAITTAEAQVSFGPRVGVNFANVNASGGEGPGADFFNDNSKSKTGFLIGAVANFGMNDLISIQPELLYSQQGYKSEFSEDGITIENNLTANYLQLPVLVKATFGDGDIKYFANIGPYVGYWMSGKVEGTDFDFDDEGNLSMTTEEYDIEFDKEKDDEDYNRMDLGLAAGIGVGYQVGAGMLTLDLRYNLGFANTIKTEGDDDRKFANRVPSLSISYMFGGN